VQVFHNYNDRKNLLSVSITEYLVAILGKILDKNRLSYCVRHWPQFIH